MSIDFNQLKKNVLFKKKHKRQFATALKQIKIDKRQM